MDDDDDDNDDNTDEYCDDPQNRATKPARKIVGVGIRLARRRRLEKRRRCFERTNEEEDEDVGEKNDDGRT